jgi:hypothetical protein
MAGATGLGGYSDTRKGPRRLKEMTGSDDLSKRMGKIIDLETARRRRVIEKTRAVHGPWWSFWFLPRGVDLERLTPVELRRGALWGPTVDRGRQNGADLGLLRLS